MERAGWTGIVVSALATACGVAVVLAVGESLVHGGGITALLVGGHMLARRVRA